MCGHLQWGTVPMLDWVTQKRESLINLYRRWLNRAGNGRMNDCAGAGVSFCSGMIGWRLVPIMTKIRSRDLPNNQNFPFPQPGSWVLGQHPAVVMRYLRHQSTLTVGSQHQAHISLASWCWTTYSILPSRAWNEGYPNVCEYFTIMGKAPTMAY